MAGGFPVELPALSVSESFVKPTTMMYRNMLAMETEALLRSHPVDVHNARDVCMRRALCERRGQLLGNEQRVHTAHSGRWIRLLFGRRRGTRHG